MAEMAATVRLDLKDDLTGKAKQAGRAAQNLLKTLKSLKAIGRTKSSANFASGMIKDIKKAQAQAKALHSTMSKAVPNRYRGAVSGINAVSSAAKRAAADVRNLNRALGRAPNYRGGANAPSGAGGGRGQGGGRGGSGGGASGGRHHAMHFPGAGIAHSLRHAVAYQATEGVIHSVRESVKTGMEQAFDAAHTKAMLKMQGEKQSEIDAALTQSKNLAKMLPQFTSAQHLEAIAELRPALVGGLKEATELAPMFQQAVGVLEAVKQGAGKHAMKGVYSHGEALDLVRALEIGGLTSHDGWSKEKIEDNMKGMIDGMTRSIVAFNGQVGAKDFHSAFKFARGDAANWSPKFATEILPTLMNELKKSSKTDASQTGNALKSMSRVVMDGVMTPDVLAKWQGLDMLEKGAFKAGKGGKMAKNGAYHGAALKGGNVWQENPYQWVQDYLLPHMKEKGINVGNRKQAVAALGGLFGNRVANHIAALLATQQAIIEKDAENVRKAKGTSGLKFLMNADPTTRMQVFSASLKDFSGALGDLASPGVMRGMKGVADWAHRTTDRVQHSSYAQALGGRFEAMIAGVFGQKIQKGKKGSRVGEYYDAGKALGDGWSKLTTATKKTLKFWEESGAVTASLNALGVAADGASVAMDTVRDFMLTPIEIAVAKAIQMVKDAAKTDGTAEEEARRWSQIPAVTDAKNSIIDTLQPIGPSPGQINGPLKLPPMVKQGSNLAKKFERPTVPTIAGMMPGPVTPSLPQLMPKAGMGIAPIADSASANVPLFKKAGVGVMSALTSGLADGGSAAAGQMSALMGNLATIAGKGVTVPVNLDTANAEARLNALMAKAGGIGGNIGGGKKPQFSGSLNDTGD